MCIDVYKLARGKWFLLIIKETDLASLSFAIFKSRYFIPTEIRRAFVAFP